MSTNDKTSSAPTKTRMTGAEVLVECLVREGVDVVFAYPGGASMPIHQALSHQPKIRTILPRHEQGGAFGAEGYGRVTGKVGVCISTSGPGATNMITSIADAYLDSTPLVAITAQVMRSLIGRGAFQETDVFGMTAPIVKHSYLVTEPEELPRIMKEAFYIASTGRPGPVVIDMPKDVQEAVFTPDFDMEMDLPGYNPVLPVPAEELEALIPLIENASRPVIYAGGGIITAEASADLLEFAERTQIPVATTLMGIGAMPETHPLSLRWLGMHGAVFANNAVNEADLVIALAARFDDRVTGAVSMFCPDSTIVHIDIDACEINKNKKVAHPIRANVKDALGVLNAALAGKGWERKSSGFTRTPEWFKTIEGWKEQYPFSYEDRKGYIAPQSVIEELYRQTADKDPIICTGVGQHQMFAAQFFKFDKPRRPGHVRRPGHHGLRPPRRHGRLPSLSGQAGRQHRRRWLHAHEHSGAGDHPRGAYARQMHHPEQPASGHGSTVGRPEVRLQPRADLPGGPARRLRPHPQDGRYHLPELSAHLRRVRRQMRACAPH